MTTSELPYHFWIDVGGTFTDCVMLDATGKLHQHKLLSSGSIKGTAEIGSGARQIVDASRIGDPADFWNGFRCSLLGDEGEVLAESEVTGFDASEGMLWLKEALPAQEGSRYELSSDLEAPVLAIRWLLGLPLNQVVPPVRLRLGTTRGTNALLTRSGARTALAVTQGFGDLLEIGSQERPTGHRSPQSHGQRL